ncbi:MAG: peroxidase [Acidobacteria bacterium]|nr:peroxidase [Acidobacteriota bacterium]
MTDDDGLLAALMQDPHAAPLSGQRRALVNYALKLTESPHSITEVDINSLREAGLSDAAVHDAAAVTAYFNFVNRMASGLGVELEAE